MNPLRHGQPWSHEEEGALRVAFEQCWSLDDLAAAHQRKRSAITSRLTYMNLIVQCDVLKGYVRCSTPLWCTYADVKE